MNGYSSPAISIEIKYHHEFFVLIPITIFEDYLHRLRSDSKQIDRLLREIARTKMITRNLRFLISIVNKYSNRGLTFLDLIQKGDMKSMKAVEKLQYRRRSKFSTSGT
jgi:DNA-directed RNA polymerase sigma subunit (sigma70/sigma32)